MINRGYKPNHKVAVPDKAVAVKETTTVQCPNCKEHNETVGSYDDDMDSQITCTKCRFTTAKWNFEFIRGSYKPSEETD